MGSKQQKTDFDKQLAALYNSAQVRTVKPVASLFTKVELEFALNPNNRCFASIQECCQWLRSLGRPCFQNCIGHLEVHISSVAGAAPPPLLAAIPAAESAAVSASSASESQQLPEPSNVTSAAGAASDVAAVSASGSLGLLPAPTFQSVPVSSPSVPGSMSSSSVATAVAATSGAVPKQPSRAPVPQLPAKRNFQGLDFMQPKNHVPAHDLSFEQCRIRAGMLSQTQELFTARGREPNSFELCLKKLFPQLSFRASIQKLQHELHVQNIQLLFDASLIDRNAPASIFHAIDDCHMAFQGATPQFQASWRTYFKRLGLQNHSMQSVTDHVNSMRWIGHVYGGARRPDQIAITGKSNVLFNPIGSCWQNSIALLVRTMHPPTFDKLSASPNLSPDAICSILNHGGFYLRKLPLYLFDGSFRGCGRNKLFKRELSTLFAELLLQKCNINIPWLRNADLDPSSIVQRVQEIMSLFPNMLPAFIMNPFNSSGVALHCVGLSIEGPHAVVMDPANASFFQLTMESLDTVCEGKWNGFRRIYCICSRNPKT